MKKSEMALVLAKAAAYDARTLSEYDVEAWYECVGDLNFKECMQAVTEHYRDSTERLMPAHLVPADLRPDVPWYNRRDASEAPLL